MAPNQKSRHLGGIIVALAGWLRTTVSHRCGASVRSTVKGGPLSEVITKDALLALVDHDPALLVELIGLFRDSAPKTLYEIRRAVECQDRAALAQAAHAFKGSVSNFGISRAFHLAGKLEQMAKQNEMSGTPLAFQDLECEAVIIDQALRNVREEVACEF